MIAAYQRISRADGDLGKDGKDKSNSIENQKELIQRYISCKESLQNVPVMDFVDDGYTGSNFDRPGFQQMMDGVRNGKIDTIIVKDLSRFGRDYIGVGEYMEQIFPLLGVRLIAINDNYDSNNYKGTTLGMDVVVSNLVNTMYCRDAGKKLRTANQVKWRKGITTASAAPFGYQFDPDKKGAFIIDLPAAKIVRRIFDLAILGLGTREIAVMLNDENVPVPSVYNKENKAYGKETTYTIAPVILWDSSRVWKILTAYVYTGAMVLGKTKTLISGKSIVRTVPKGQQFITEGTHEAIVSREEFEKAQLVIKSNSHKVLMGRVDFPLKGKVRCGNCRRVMAHNFKQVVPTFWCREGLELVGQTQCTSEIFQVSDIESAVFQALKKELSLLDSLYGDIQKEEQALKEAHKKANRRKTLMEQELKNLKGEKMRMYEEYAAGTLPLDTYKQKKRECDRRISEVQEQIEQSKAEESAESVVPGTVRAAAEQAENFLNGTRLTAGMVSAFIENVFVHDGGRIVVRFKYERSIRLFEGIKYVLPILHPNKKRLALIMCPEEDSASVEWARQKGENWVNKDITSLEFVENIFRLMNWNRECRYKVLGRVANSDQGLCMLFDLEEAIMFTPKPQEYADPLTGEMKKKQMKFFPDTYRNRIGKSYNDYIADHQMNMFEDFIGYQGSAVLDEPVREEDSFSKESMSQESEISENILLPDLAKQSESIEQQSGEIAERGMPT